MATPSRAYPTIDDPDTTTPDVTRDLAQLANAIDADQGALLGTSAPLAAGALTLASGTGNASWERVGRLVVVRFDNTRTLAVGLTAVVAAGGVPAAVRPAGGDAFGGGWLDGNYAGVAMVTAAGAVAIAHQTGASRGRGQGTIVYTVDVP